MIQMTINGKVVHPDTSQSIKITYENPFVKDSGTYSYEIQFPMAILQNRQVFGNVDRIEVKKGKATFDECRMYVDNRLVMDGKGTVTKITNTTVSLQLIGGKSRIKYNSKFEQHYIDEIDYPDVVVTHGLDQGIYSQFRLNASSLHLGKNPGVLYPSLKDSPLVGQPGVAIFSPVENEANNRTYNHIFYGHADHYYKGIKISYTEVLPMMGLLSVQPNLLYVLQKCLEYEGYTLFSSSVDNEPWNLLYIANARRTVRIKEALPHWTVYQLIEEVRKLLNVTFLFDDVKKEVSILGTNEQSLQTAVSYDIADEFSCEYDEDGLSSYLTSNLEYQFDNSANRMWWDSIPLDVMRAYDIKEFATSSEAMSWANAQTKKVQAQTILKVSSLGESIYRINYTHTDDKGNETIKVWERCGFFSPLVRDLKSDDAESLKIIPAAMYLAKRPSDSIDYGDKMKGKEVVMPSVSNTKDIELEDLTYDEEADDYYFSVQDALESGNVEKDAETAEEEIMPVMFAGNQVRNLDTGRTVDLNYHLTHSDENPKYRYPITYTHWMMFDGAWQTVKENGSLAIRDMFVSSQSVRKDLEVDKNNKLCMKFYTDRIPDPSMIYLFRNKRYLCEKVELNIVNGEISREKTGYFYELL